MDVVSSTHVYHSHTQKIVLVKPSLCHYKFIQTEIHGLFIQGLNYKTEPMSSISAIFRPEHWRVVMDVGRWCESVRFTEKLFVGLNRPQIGKKIAKNICLNMSFQKN